MKKARFLCIHGSDDKNIDQGGNGRKTCTRLWNFRIRMYHIAGNGKMVYTAERVKLNIFRESPGAVMASGLSFRGIMALGMGRMVFPVESLAVFLPK